MKKDFLFLLSLCLVIFSCSNEETVPSITLNQLEIIISSEGGSQTVSFDSNVSWTVISSANWCVVSPSSGDATTKSTTVTLANNDTYDDRSCTVTIRAGSLYKAITITQSRNLGFIVTPVKYDLSNDASTIDVEVKANVEYDVSISDEWITQVTTRSLTTTKLQFNIAKNSSYDNRDGSITIKQKGGTQSSTIKVYQSQEDAIIISNKREDISNNSQTLYVELKTNVNFEVVIPEAAKSWVSYSTTRTLRTETLSLSIAENKNYKNRTAEIYIKNKITTLKDTLTISQDSGILPIADGVSWSHYYTDKIYITNSKKELFESIDNCKSWNYISKLSFYAYMFLPIDASTLYASNFKDIFKSNDNGETWTRLPDNGEDDPDNSIVASRYAYNSFDVDIPTKDVYASTPWGGLFRNDGNKWCKIYEIPSNSSSQSVVVDQNSNVFFATYFFAIYKSVNKGLNWINTPSWWGDSWINRSSPEVLYVTDENIVLMGSYWHGVYKLENNEWISISKGLPNRRGVRLIVTKGDNYYCLVSDQHGHEGLYYSSNKGQDWNSCKFNLTTSDIEDLGNLSINKSGLVIITIIDKGHFYLNKTAQTWDLIK